MDKRCPLPDKWENFLKKILGVRRQEIGVWEAGEWAKGEGKEQRGTLGTWLILRHEIGEQHGKIITFLTCKWARFLINVFNIFSNFWRLAKVINSEDPFVDRIVVVGQLSSET